MGINVTALRNKLAGGGARPSLFYANVFFPTALNEALDTTAISDASFFMKAAAIPETSLNEITKSFLGRDFKVPSIDRTFGPWTVTIINDEDYKTRHLFEAWIEYISPGAAIFEAQSGFGGTANQTVFGQMQVHQLKKNGGESTTGTEFLGSYYFKDAFPTNVSEISLSWDDKDTIEEFSVTFAYQYWVKSPAALGVDGSPATNPFTSDTGGVEDASRWAVPKSATTGPTNSFLDDLA